MKLSNKSLSKNSKPSMILRIKNEWRTGRWIHTIHTMIWNEMPMGRITGCKQFIHLCISEARPSYVPQSQSHSLSPSPHTLPFRKPNRAQPELREFASLALYSSLRSFPVSFRWKSLNKQLSCVCKSKSKSISSSSSSKSRSKRIGPCGNNFISENGPASTK